MESKAMFPKRWLAKEYCFNMPMIKKLLSWLAAKWVVVLPANANLSY
jgi:hypothetical protein